MHNAFFVDLFVRVSNVVAIAMYTKVGAAASCQVACAHRT